MANAKLDWVLFEKAAAAVKQPRETELTGVSGPPRSIPGKVLPSASGPGKPSGRVPPGTGHHDAPKSRYEALRRAGGKTVRDAMHLTKRPGPPGTLGHGGLMERLRSSVSPERFPKPKK